MLYEKPMKPLIDIKALDEQTFGDPDIRAEIIGMFRDQAPMIIQAIDAGADGARSMSAHRLKGSALAIGAAPLADAASRLEANPSDSVALDDTRRLLDATIQALGAMDESP